MPFTNPIVGGTALVRTAINSPNYVPGSVGWSINQDGTAEFSSAILRGELDVGPTSPSPRIVLTSTIPATLSAASTDFTWTSVKLMYYNATEYYFEAVGIFNVGPGSPFPIYATGTYDATHGVIFNEFEQGPGAPQSLKLLYDSDTYNSSALTWAYRHGSLFMTSTSTLIVEGAFQAVNLKADISGFPETWHIFPYANGWFDNASGFRHLMYRKTALNEVQIIGTAKSPNPFNSVIGTFPAGYRPVDTQPMWASTNQGTDQVLTVDLNGVLTAFGSTTVNQPWFINGVFTLDT